jgi:hypothetical protein
VIASNATMLAYTARLNTARPDPHWIGQYWSDRIQQMLEAAMRDHDLLPEGQVVDVRFDEFMADDIATVERIYAVAGQPFDAGVRSHMERFMLDHPRGRHGGVIYDLAGDFGVDPGALRQAMRGYTERFGVAEER